MSEWPVFSLPEANEITPEISALTDATLASLERLRRTWAHLPFEPFDALRGARRNDLMYADWAREVAALGAQPKGYFTVDFQSPHPDILWCWTYGEDRISHQHTIWETFADRRLIDDDFFNADENVEPDPFHDSDPASD